MVGVSALEEPTRVWERFKVRPDLSLPKLSSQGNHLTIHIPGLRVGIEAQLPVYARISVQRAPIDCCHIHVLDNMGPVDDVVVCELWCSYDSEKTKHRGIVSPLCFPVIDGCVVKLWIRLCAKIKLGSELIRRLPTQGYQYRKPAKTSRPL